MDLRYQEYLCHLWYAEWHFLIRGKPKKPMLQLNMYSSMASAEFAGAQPIKSNNFTRQRYDACEMKDAVARSTGPGRYMMATTDLNCMGCFIPNPKVRLQKKGDSEKAHYGRTDVESELLNLSRSASKCPSREYNPATNPVSRDSALHMPDCRDLPFDQDTRMTNPACNLRGTGINRFEWPCTDPQKSFEIPFDWGIQARILAKDTHRPCVPRPIDVTPSLPMPPIPAAPRPNAAPTVPIVINEFSKACLGTDAAPIAPIGPSELRFNARPELR